MWRVDGAEREARLVGAAPCEDLAVVQVSERDGLKTLPLAPSDSIEQGGRSSPSASRPARATTTA